MSHAIIRGKSGRRHEVDFKGCALRVEVHASDETVEIFVEADTDELPHRFNSEMQQAGINGMAERAVERRAGSRACRRRRWERSEHP